MAYKLRDNDVAGNGPGGECWPRRRVSFQSANEGSKCV
jgi:hypothetical protein